MTRPHARPILRRRLLAIALAALVLLAAGCDLRLRVPEGDAPLRYRDLVFSSAVTTTGIVYGSAVDQGGTTRTLALDLYRPSGDVVTGRPAIVWVHGGSFRSGTRTSPEIVDQATTFARKGYVSASITYRLAPNGCTTVTNECLVAIRDAKHDAQASVRFLRANAAQYGIDPDRISIAGTSAGAITAVNVGFSSPDDVGASGTPGVSSRVRSAVSLSGARILTTPTATSAPALLLHGTADVVVPYQWAVDTVEQARAAGVHVELTSWAGAGHVPYVAHRQEILDQTTNFLWWTLDLRTAPT